MHTHLRIARPVSNLSRSVTMYHQGLGLVTVGQFQDHEGFSGAMLGHPNSADHFEFTVCHAHPIAPAPTPEDLLVLYFPELEKWRKARDRMLEAGFTEVAPFNPYWRKNGCTFEDHDGYRVVLEQDEWNADELG